MKLLLFSKFKDKIKDKTKTRTTRLHNKPQLKVGDKVKLVYAPKHRWTPKKDREDLALVKIISVNPVLINIFSVILPLELSEKDYTRQEGFKNLKELLKFFFDLYCLDKGYLTFYTYEWVYL